MTRAVGRPTRSLGEHRSDRYFVLDDDDRFASLHEQWLDHVRRRYHRGPDPQDEVLATVVGLCPHSVLEVGAGRGQFAARLDDHLDALRRAPGAAPARSATICGRFKAPTRVAQRSRSSRGHRNVLRTIPGFRSS